LRNTPFHDQVLAILPKLRIQAMALTRNRSAAEDLVQEAVCNALRAQASFVHGTNFPAWMHRILRNRFISDLRKRRDTADIADVPEAAFATSAAHGDSLALKELGRAMARLPADQREALLMVAVHGMGYEAVGRGGRLRRKEPGIPGTPPFGSLATGRGRPEKFDPAEAAAKRDTRAKGSCAS